MYNRYYDENPSLSLAISLIKNSKNVVRLSCADYIISLAQKNNVDLHSGLIDSLKFSLKRWYDDEKTLFEALEYLRNAAADVQKQISLEVIEFIQKAEELNPSN